MTMGHTAMTYLRADTKKEKKRVVSLLLFFSLVLTKVLHFLGPFVNVIGNAGLSEQHGQGEAGDTCTHNQDLGSFWRCCVRHRLVAIDCCHVCAISPPFLSGRSKEGSSKAGKSGRRWTSKG